jgi:ABC-type branched-subunit amino acid transport system substrate-binding protein
MRARRLSLLRVSAVVLVAAASLAACGTSSTTTGSSAAAAACKGPEVRLGMIGPVKTSEADITPAIQSAEAAVDAVNSTCELGGPVKLITCNDQYDPNVAAQCGREMVSDHVIALVGSQSQLGDSYTPITSAAGIPEVGSLAGSNDQYVSALSYPMVNSVVALASAATVAKSLGAKKLEVVGIDVSAVQQLLALLQGSVKTAGLAYGGAVLVPPTATDFSQYAAQAVATGSDAIFPVLPTAANIAFVRALAQQGTNFNKVRVIVDGVTTSPQDISQMGSDANGMYVVGSAWPSSDTSNAGIKQYNTELKTYGFDSVDKDDMSVIAWSDVHIVANLLKGSSSMTAATLVSKLNSAGPMSLPQLAPFNWSRNAFPGNPVFSKMRAFSTDGVIEQVVNGVETPVTNGYVNLFSTFTIKNP